MSRPQRDFSRHSVVSMPDRPTATSAVRVVLDARAVDARISEVLDTENPRLRFHLLRRLYDDMRASEALAGLTPGEIGHFVASLSRLCADDYDRVREIVCEIMTYACDRVQDAKGEEHVAAVRGVAHFVLPFFRKVFEPVDGVPEPVDEVRLSFYRLLRSLLLKKYYWATADAARYLGVVALMLEPGLEDSYALIRELSCLCVRGFVGDHSELARLVCTPRVVNGLGSCVRSNAVRVRVGGVRALGAVLLDRPDLDVVEACRTLRTVASSENFMALNAFVEVAGQLLREYRNRGEAFFVNILPPFLAILGDECVELRTAAEEQWRDAAASFWFEAADTAPDEDVQEQDYPPPACVRLLQRYAPSLVSSMCGCVLATTDTKLRVATVRGLRVLAEHIGLRLAGSSDRFIEALSYAQADRDADLREACVSVGEVLGATVPAFVWAPLLQSVVLSCTNSENEATGDMAGNPIAVCLALLSGIPEEGYPAGGLTEELSDGRVVSHVVLDLLGFPAFNARRMDIVRDVAECVVKLHGFLKSSEVNVQTNLRMLHLIFRVLPLFDDYDGDLCARTKAVVRDLPGVGVFFDQLIDVGLRNGWTAQRDLDWLKFESCFYNGGRAVLDRHEAVVELLLETTAREDAEPTLRLRSYAVVADLARRCALLDPDDFPDMTHVASETKTFLALAVVPELAFAPGATKRVMHSAALELVVALLDTGKVFGDSLEAFELSLVSRIAALVEHPKFETRVKACRYLSDRLRHARPDHHEVLVDVVYPMLLAGMEDVMAKVRAPACLAMYRLCASLRVPSQVPDERKQVLVDAAASTVFEILPGEDGHEYDRVLEVALKMTKFSPKVAMEALERMAAANDAPEMHAALQDLSNLSVNEKKSS